MADGKIERDARAARRPTQRPTGEKPQEPTPVSGETPVIQEEGENQGEVALLEPLERGAVDNLEEEEVDGRREGESDDHRNEEDVNESENKGERDTREESEDEGGDYESLDEVDDRDTEDEAHHGKKEAKSSTFLGAFRRILTPPTTSGEKKEGSPTLLESVRNILTPGKGINGDNQPAGNLGVDNGLTQRPVEENTGGEIPDETEENTGEEVPDEAGAEETEGEVLSRELFLFDFEGESNGCLYG